MIARVSAAHAPLTRGLVGLLLYLCAASAAAHGVRLDDSTSPRSRVAAQVVLDEAGRPLDRSPSARRAVVRFGRIDYRLATAAFAGRQARIYYVIPGALPWLRSPQGLRVEWRGLTRFASGQARAGERVLVWTGVVTQAWMSEALELTAEVDLAQTLPSFANQFGFESYFEIEVIP